MLNKPLPSRWQLVQPVFFIFIFIYAILETLLSIFLEMHDTISIIIVALETCVIIILFIMYLLAPRHLKYLKERLERALQSDPVLLAKEQPVPRINTLELPTNIRLRVKTVYILLFFFILLAIFLGFIIGIAIGGIGKIVDYTSFLALYYSRRSFCFL
jgi:hypothetical protein